MFAVKTTNPACLQMFTQCSACPIERARMGQAELVVVCSQVALTSSRNTTTAYHSEWPAGCMSGTSQAASMPGTGSWQTIRWLFDYTTQVMLSVAG